MRYSALPVSAGIGLLALILLGQPALCRAGAIVVDDFNDNSLNLQLWSPYIEGTGSVSEVNQRLETTAAGSGEGIAFVRLLGLIGGDFDAQVSYTLLSTLTSAKDTFGGIAWVVGGDLLDNPQLVGRGYGGYGCEINGGGSCAFPSTDISGRLRMTRVGTTLSVYYWDGSGWQFMDATSTSGAPSSIGIGASSGSTTPVSFAFDDFQLQADGFTSIPEPGSMALVGISLALVCGFRKRHPGR